MEEVYLIMLAQIMYTPQDSSRGKKRGILLTNCCAKSYAYNFAKVLTMALQSAFAFSS